jgi:hypothetical protein
MPVRYVLIFENSFVVLDAEPGLAGMSVLAAASLVLPRYRDERVQDFKPTSNWIPFR